MYRKYFKRIFDVIFASIMIICTIPIILLFSIIIAADSRGPVFILQERIGKKGNVFMLLKLRSLKVNKKRLENQIFNKHPDMTRVGKFIRRFKIDELPQIFNVLTGDMSIIGPRPCLPSLKEKFDKNAHYRLQVRPGITGWAQVNGNIKNSWTVRWQYDRYYVENLSFLLDLKIIFKTIFIIIFGE